jgi:hypothetical protein
LRFSERRAFFLPSGRRSSAMQNTAVSKGFEVGESWPSWVDEVLDTADFDPCCR